MKKLLIPLFVLIPAMSTGVLAQDVQANLDQALSSYQSEDLRNARFLLQDALEGINQETGKKILGILPSDMSGMKTIQESDNVTGMSTGFAGLFVSRYYGGENRDASIEIISDSPMLAGINAILTMPGFMTSDPDQKRISIDNYRGLMTRSTDDQGKVSWDVQVPLNSTLLTFQCSGTDNEQDVLNMANSIPVGQIATITQ